MATPTTTFAAIRDKMETLIIALSPATLADVRFKLERGEKNFEEWAEDNPSACLRVFAIREIGEGDDELQMTNSDLEHVQTLAEVIVAYPKHYGKYGRNAVQSARDMIREDRKQIDGQSGIGIHNASGYVSGQDASQLEGRSIEGDDEEDSPVLFSRMVFRVDYKESVTA